VKTVALPRAESTFPIEAVAECRATLGTMLPPGQTQLPHAKRSDYAVYMFIRLVVCVVGRCPSRRAVLPAGWPGWPGTC
jgi:hypothetical protein